MSLATARLFAILCPIDGGALPKWKPKVAGDHAALRFSLCRWGQTQLLGPKSTPGEPSDIGRIGMLEQSGNCCGLSTIGADGPIDGLSAFRAPAGVSSVAPF